MNRAPRPVSLTLLLCACAWTPREGCVIGLNSGGFGTSDIGVFRSTFNSIDTGDTFDSRDTGDTGDTDTGTCAATLVDSVPSSGAFGVDPFSPVGLVLSDAVTADQISVSAPVPGALAGDGTLWTWTPDLPLRGDQDWLLVITVCGRETALPFRTLAADQVTGWLDGRTYRLDPGAAPPSPLLDGHLSALLIAWEETQDGLIATVGQADASGQQDLCVPAAPWAGDHALPWLSAAGTAHATATDGSYLPLTAEFGLTALPDGTALVGALTLAAPRSTFAAMGVDPDALCADLSGLSGCADVGLPEEQVLLYMDGLTAEPVEIPVVPGGC